MPDARFTAVFIALGGLFGLTGVALAAAAAHGPDARLLGGASAMCLAHAPALLALAALLGRLAFARFSGSALGLGTVLFSADLVMRHAAGQGLFPMSAPTGGLLMMIGWLGVTAGGLLALIRSGR